MSDIAISVSNLGKKYRLYGSPKHRFIEALDPFRRKYHRDFWALRDVSFEVKKGESIGIIGQNGSGKSTLLQLICGILQPTEGTVGVTGKISALLELGAGFNMEYTGRDNVYMNGAILGFSREEIDEGFQDIVNFAEIGEFINQPVKTYSSGMFVRLAFAMAINVDPDILIVDEALAVGDIRFQLKCFRKMEEFKEKGKTFMVVAHDMGSVQNLCRLAIWLREGHIYQIGPAKDVVHDCQAFMYHGLLPGGRSKGEETIGQNVLSGSARELASRIEWYEVPPNASVSGEGGVAVKKIALYRKDPFEKISILTGGEEVILFFDINVQVDIACPLVSFIVYDEFGKQIFGTNNYVLERPFSPLVKGESSIASFEFRFPRLHNGRYVISPGIGDGTQDNHIRRQVIFDAYVVHVASSDIKQKQGVLLKLDDASVSLH